ncbi:hypothetical protein DFJ43DRAFT_861109 [Lentinula guzmanii]|uniref:Uncharacterized protein n=1 Tax=Lentinula guzmanii TaxID=2804957 RepID=A0AA38JHQ6_9AGAR|nr:hypothetical protein DFJ43DRAFT_861109 [Lentinula guzmanii]
MFLRVLSIFKAIRAFVFAICMMLSIGCATVLSIFLLRQWSDFDLMSRIIVVILTVVHSLGAILLYLMIVVQFKVLLDAARVSIYLLFVLCGALLLVFGRARLPCSNSGIGNICGQSTLFIVIASFTISGFLLFYSVALAIIAHTIPRPLLVKAPSDIVEEGLTSISSRTNLITPREKIRLSRDEIYMDKRTHGLERHHAPRPLDFTKHSERAELAPVFNYTVTSSPTTTSSLSTPMSSGMSYKAPLIRHPYAVSEPLYSRDSPLPSAYFSRPATPLIRNTLSPSSTLHSYSLRVGYPERPSIVPSMSNESVQSSRSLNNAVTYGARPLESRFPELTRSGSAQSAPPDLGVSQIPPLPDHPLPNPFQDPISRVTTPSASSTISSGGQAPTGLPTVSLSFGRSGFPLPPSNNLTTWSQYTNDYLKLHTSNQSQSPPSTPLSLRPGVDVKSKRFAPPVVVPRRPLSFGSIAASLHSTNLPSPPTPAARLLPHPRLQAHLELVSSQDAAVPGSTEFIVAMNPVGTTTPTSAKTSRSQFLPTDIPDWLASEHRT